MIVFRTSSLLQQVVEAATCNSILIIEDVISVAFATTQQQVSPPRWTFFVANYKTVVVDFL